MRALCIIAVVKRFPFLEEDIKRRSCRAAVNAANRVSASEDALHVHARPGFVLVSILFYEVTYTSANHLVACGHGDVEKCCGCPKASNVIFPLKHLPLYPRHRLIYTKSTQQSDIQYAYFSLFFEENGAV